MWMCTYKMTLRTNVHHLRLSVKSNFRQRGVFRGSSWQTRENVFLLYETKEAYVCFTVNVCISSGLYFANLKSECLVLPSVLKRHLQKADLLDSNVRGTCNLQLGCVCRPFTPNTTWKRFSECGMRTVNLHDILFLCPDVCRIWDEPPKVSFLTSIRGLHLSFLVICVLCSMCAHSPAWSWSHLLPVPPFVLVLIKETGRSSYFLLSFSPSSTLRSIPTQDMQGRSLLHLCIMPTPPVLPVPVWREPTLTADPPARSSVPSSWSPPSPTQKTFPAFQRSHRFRSASVTLKI